MLKKSFYVLVLITLVLSACRQEEQNRPLKFEKGVYGGEADEALTVEQKNALQRRIRHQEN